MYVKKHYGFGQTGGPRPSTQKQLESGSMEDPSHAALCLAQNWVDWNIDWHSTGLQTSLHKTVLLPSCGLNLQLQQNGTMSGL